MVSENTQKSAKFVRIINVLKAMLSAGDITEKEYNRAKQYYAKLTGADIIIVG